MDSDISNIAVGHLVALTVENCDQEPLLGKVIKIMDEEIQIVWLEGDYSSSWRVAKYSDPQNRRKKIEWTDTVPKASVLLFDFELTATNHLRKSTSSHLKRKYAEIKQKKNN